VDGTYKVEKVLALGGRAKGIVGFRIDLSKLLAIHLRVNVVVASFAMRRFSLEPQPPRSSADTKRKCGQESLSIVHLRYFMNYNQGLVIALLCPRLQIKDYVIGLSRIVIAFT